MENYAAIKERLVAASDVGAGRGRRRLLPRDRRAAAGGRAASVVAISAARSRRRPTCSSTIIACSCRGAARAADRSPHRAGAARRAQRPERGFRVRRGARARARRRGRSRAALRRFPGLAHRMEQVGRIGAVLFVNDSKATNADAAEKALLSFRRHLLDSRRQGEGGRHRAASSAVSVACAKAYLIGAATRGFRARRSTAPSPSSAAERSRRRSPPPRATRSAATRRSPSCCCRRPAPPTINSPISRRAATRSARSSRTSCRIQGEPDMISQSRTRPRRRLAAQRRRLAARRLRRPDGDRRRDGARRQPGGRRAHRPADRSISSTARGAAAAAGGDADAGDLVPFAAPRAARRAGDLFVSIALIIARADVTAPR